jgi:hypothetical protein
MKVTAHMNEKNKQQEPTKKAWSIRNLILN